MSLRQVIRTDRLVLRPFVSSDGPGVFAYSRDPAWARFQQTTPSSELEAERVLAGLLARDRAVAPAWAITRGEAALGIVSLVFAADHREGLLGYRIHAEHRGLGLTSEAVRAVLSEAFAAYEQLAGVTARTHAWNARSTRLLARLGFVDRSPPCDAPATHDTVRGATYELRRSAWPPAGFHAPA